jgi:hypothetical protein
MYKKEQSFGVLTGTVLLGCNVEERSWVSGGTPTIRTLTTAQFVVHFRPDSNGGAGLFLCARYPPERPSSETGHFNLHFRFPAELAA